MSRRFVAIPWDVFASGAYDANYRTPHGWSFWVLDTKTGVLFQAADSQMVTSSSDFIRSHLDPDRLPKHDRNARSRKRTP